MLVVVQKGHEAEIRAVFPKWDLRAEIIGEVTSSDLSLSRTAMISWLMCWPRRWCSGMMLPFRSAKLLNPNTTMMYYSGC
ncbi:MAG: hypothetical protein O7D34_12400 [Ignavibacteria bacterium]|nr:hypothetical protein [Ignavibacteria bacterium]